MTAAYIFDGPRTLSMRQILAEVAARHGISEQELRGPSRHRRFAWPRHEAMHAMLSEGRWSSVQIGRFFNRDHSTVLVGAAAHVRRREEAATK